MMAILRLNDGKHFLNQPAEVNVDKVFGSINQEGILVFYSNEVLTIRKHFEPLYANHLQFIGRVIEA
jgi:hypothetical protein